MACPTHRLPCAVAALALGCSGTAPPAGPDLANCAEHTNWKRPVPLVRVDPIYPEPALRERIEGYVEIESSIGPRGQVVDPIVVDAEPPGEFDSAALYAYSQWQYCPPTGGARYPDRIWTRLHFDLP
jgi:TonB family protein